MSLAGQMAPFTAPVRAIASPPLADIRDDNHLVAIGPKD
jgi:hypothetical protein